MSLPTSFLQHIEQHSCFTGCYGSDSIASVCLDPVRPLEPLVLVTCQDCLTRFGAPQALLPPGMSSHQLAQVLSDHVRIHRGFSLARSGYFVAGTGFWLAVVYYGAGLFLVNADRSRQLGSDLDMLIRAFQHGVVTPPDPAMRDPKLYSLQTVHVNFSRFQSGITSKQAFLASPQCRTSPRTGWCRVTLAEFLPLAQAAASPTPVPGPTVPATSPTQARGSLQPGQTCPKCGAVVQFRPLFNGSYLGCLCN